MLRDGKRSKGSSGTAAKSRRRSARLLLNAYPPELHHLLYDKEGNNLIDLDDGQEITSLEEVEMVDVQLAAELHVLHGIRPNKEGSKKMNAAVASEAREEQGEEEDEGESDQESQDDDEEEEGEEEEEGDESLQTHRHFHHHHHHHHHHHQPFEQPLGSESGYDGDDRLRGQAREIVYDTANYGPENGYAPLRAWRERWEPIDGNRAEHRLARDEIEGNEDDDEEEEGENTPLFVGEEESESATPSGDYAELDDHGGLPTVQIDLDNSHRMVNAIEHAIADGTISQSDVDAVNEHPDDASDDSDYNLHEEDEEDDEDLLIMEVREMAIALSHGLYPYHESKRLKRAMTEHNFKTGRQVSHLKKDGKNKEGKREDAQNGESTDEGGTVPLQNVWRMEKRIDWVIVESIMIVMFCNIRHAVVNHGWGRSFKLPDSARSLTGRDAEARNLYSHQGSGLFYQEWRNLLCLPCGWNMSRGDSRRVPGIKEDGDAKTEEPADDSKEKPFDYAAVESTWIGTYAFLDWSKWATFNARDPITRGLPESSNSSDPTRPLPLGNPGIMPSLKNEREAVGDCLQLRLELLPIAEQVAANKREEVIEELEGPKSAKYPPLRFKGHTLTYDEGPPLPRGQVHGVVRPIFATANEEYYSRDDTPTDEERAIVGLHWDLVHRYDGEDRWSLSGIQPGPPGTKAPIYGVWGSSQRSDELSPCGPFTYFLVDERPWKEVDTLLAEEGRQ
ncbi:hypothetical protein CBS101457_005596 [Exobasidium rhododendri]|nr:hypothetical protein CBS101457_005596 [Exobasidium rhododendri]